MASDGIPSLSPRHQRLVSQWVEAYRSKFAMRRDDEVAGYIIGWKEAVRFLWPDAESLMAQDPQATEYVCRTIALEHVLLERMA